MTRPASTDARLNKPVKLTKSVVDRLTPKASTYILYDGTLAGFGCRVTPSGGRSWVVEYRPHGGGRGIGKKRITLGKLGTFTPDEARKQAQEVLTSVRRGEEVKLDWAARRKAPTVQELADRFMREEVTPTRKPGTAALYEIYFRKHILPEIGDKRAREVTPADIGKLHRKIGEDTRVTANRCIVVVSGLFTWAARIGEIPEEIRPARGVTRFREQGRERYLTSNELARLGEVLRQAESIGLPWDVDETIPMAKHIQKDNRITKVSPFVTEAIRLLLFTGCRLREILHLRWSDFDEERGVLMLPDSKTGRKVVVLSQPALEVLARIPKAGDFVIASSRPDQPRHDIKGPWDSIRRCAGLEDFRLHDLRHSFGATGAGSNFGLPVVGKLLGHRNTETTSRYAHIAVDPLKAAADAIAGKLASSLGSAKGWEGKVE